MSVESHTIKARGLDSMQSKTLGLMFAKDIKPVYFKSRFGIHTFFVREPIFVLILDDHFVIRRKKLIKPWRMFFWSPQYQHVIELPSTSRAAQRIKVNDKVALCKTK